MAAVRSKKQGTPAVDRLINRELSFLDYDARVLDVAADAGLPLLQRVRVLLDLLARCSTSSSWFASPG